MEGVGTEGRLREALLAIHACRLRRDGSDPGYGWNITALNKAINEALPLLDIEPPQIDPRYARMAESADRTARIMGATFVLKPANTSTLEREGP